MSASEYQTPTAQPETIDPPAAPAATDVVSIPRGLFNAVIVGAVLFVIGLIVGWTLSERSFVNTELLIDRAVATAVAALPQQVATAPAAQPTADPNRRFAVSDAGSPSLGPSDAPVTIIEFGDFRCGFCKRFKDETLTRIMTNYEGQVRFVYRDYPILGPDSVNAAFAAGCAQGQGKFWEFHDLLYANQANLNRDAFLTYAAALEMDVEAFTTCYDNQQYQQQIVRDYTDGQNLGISGTPAFFVNGKFISGAQPYEIFARVIDAELAALVDQPAAS